MHTVALGGFWIDRTEVTNAQYKRCVEAGACEVPALRNLEYEDAAKTDHPKVFVEWLEAEAYCTWAGVRPPTEAEWEYAARGPESLEYPWGDEFHEARLNTCLAPDAGHGIDCTLTSWDDDTVGDDDTKSAPVGSYPEGASWCGALDMAGNVWEWVGDRFGRYSSDRQESPTGAAAGELRVMRGGSWDATSYEARSSYRFALNADQGLGSWVGFRCAKDAD